MTEKQRIAGRQLDAEVAERVMGMALPTWTPTHDECGRARLSSRPIEWLSWPWEVRYWGTDKAIQWEPRRYSTDIAAAFQVVEAMRGKGMWVFISNSVPADEWEVILTTPDGDGPAYNVAAPTLPLAICLASLAALAALDAEQPPAKSAVEGAVPSHEEPTK